MYLKIHAGAGPRLRPGPRTAAMLAAACLTATLVPAASAAPSPRPDLTTKSVSVTATAKTGGEIAVATKVKNASRTKAPATRTTFALSTDKAAGGDIALPVKGKVMALKPGKGAAVKASVLVPDSTPDGSYFVIACADAAKKVRETKEKNNCRASQSPVEVSSAVEGTLSGTLTFADKGENPDQRSRWDRTATANIKMSVSGPHMDEVFASTGSTYGMAGTVESTSTAGDCITTRVDTEAGSGTLLYTGDPYNDEVRGKFTMTDLTGLGLAVYLPHNTETKVTQTGPASCSPGTTVTTTRARFFNDIELQQVSRTATTITYRPVKWVDLYSGKSPWDTITGDIVLTLN